MFEEGLYKDRIKRVLTTETNDYANGGGIVKEPVILVLAK
jgi:hypothetical protein